MGGPSWRSSASAPSGRMARSRSALKATGSIGSARCSTRQGTLEPSGKCDLPPFAAPGDPGAGARTRARPAERGVAFPGHVRRHLTRCLMLAFRYTAVSDEKREGLIWLGFNLGTGAVVNDVLARLRPAAGADGRLAGARSGDAARGRPRMERGDVAGRVAPAARPAGARRTWSHSCAPCAAVSSATATGSMPITTTCAAPRSSGSRRWRRRKESGPRPTGGARGLRVEAIEREYRAKLDDLRHNYALRVTVEWVQALELYVPVQRFDVLIRRRKGER